MERHDQSHERYYRALKARDARFDGRFFVGVSTTGIYCRAICPARTPRSDRCTFYLNAAAAEAAGYRPCMRCRPEIAPGVARTVAPVDAVRTAAHWAAARIDAGALNHGSVEQLAARYGISARQLRRVVEVEYGVTPVALAQTRRLLLAKQLLTDSSLGMAEVAQASGFSSVRRFNHLFRTRYGLNPGAMRRKGARATADGAITLKLAYRPPLDWPRLLAFLDGRGAVGVECVQQGRYLRTVQLDGHHGWFGAQPLPRHDALELQVSAGLMPVLTPLIARVRSLFDLDANPEPIEQQLARHAALRAIVRRQPGLRVPGAVNGFELALRAILGQQVTVKAATTIFGRFAAAFGEAAETPYADLRFFSPTAGRVAAAPLPQLIRLGLTRKRAQTVSTLAREVAEGHLLLEAGVAPEQAMQQLQAIAGIGAWTANYIAMRALNHPDAFPHSDLGLMQALKLRKPKEILDLAEAWRPWRAYAAMHLWTSLGGDIDKGA
ncbi:MAG TPA: AlkA N-terminal domain-containing protein [Stenotrophobium sp.]|nr:AlkA N-terminal domain-containing protein [Stenotrophobium sp.]